MFRASLVLGFIIGFPGIGWATTYYVDSQSGSDSNDGRTQTTAFRSVSRVNSTSLGSGDVVLFRRGQSFDGQLDVDSVGSSSSPVQFGAFGSGNRPTLFAINISGRNVVLSDFLVEHGKDASDAIRVRNASGVVIRDMEIRNGTRDAIDVDGSSNILVENVEIHHFLNGSYGSKDDAHGVAITNTQGITIRGANIHHVSGDSVQSDPNRSPGNISNNIVIEDSELWTSPLASDFNSGWRAGNSPGENALDTKVLTSGFENEIRMNIVVRNVIAHGWEQVPQISNRAAFNLKEKINATMERITVYDSEIAFRVRGSLGNADTVISNSVIYNVGTGIRAEDNASNLRVYFTTFGSGNGTHLDLAGSTSGMSNWDWRNNAFLGGRPSTTLVSGATNANASASDFANASQGDYSLDPSSSLIDAGQAIAGITVDRAGNPRSAPHDIGAYDLSGSSKRPMPPVLRVD